MSDIIVLYDDDNTALKNKILAQYPYAVFLSSSSTIKQIVGSVNSKNFWVILPYSNIDVKLEDMLFDQYEQTIVNSFCADDGANAFYVNRLLLIKNLNKLKNAQIDKINTLPIKEHSVRVCSKCIIPFDIFVIEYDEGESDFNVLNSRFPGRVRKIQNIDGIFNAHKMAALQSSTSHFYVVDADCIVLDTFNFDIEQSFAVDSGTVYVWNSKNQLNGLIYGNGGIKLFHKSMFEKDHLHFLDMTMEICQRFKSINEIASISRLDSTAFTAWRRAFRECVKLTLNQNCEISQLRLNTWMKRADGKFALHSLHGARDGNLFALENAADRSMLLLINDFKWLKTRFSSFFGTDDSPAF